MFYYYSYSSQEEYKSENGNIRSKYIYHGKSQRSFPPRNLKSSQTQSKQLQRTFKGQVLFRAKFIRGLTKLNYCFTSIPADKYSLKYCLSNFELKRNSTVVLAETIRIIFDEIRCAMDMAYPGSEVPIQIKQSRYDFRFTEHC